MPPTRTAPATRKRSGGSFLFGLFIGVVIGLGVSLAIAFYLNRTPVPFLTAKPKQAEKDTGGKPPAIAGLPQTATAPGTAPEKPKFDFYKILPGTEEPVTERELRERLRASRSGQQEVSKDVYFIQAGSFQNPADADNQKARLAILGAPAELVVIEAEEIGAGAALAGRRAGSSVRAPATEMKLAAGRRESVSAGALAGRALPFMICARVTPMVAAILAQLMPPARICSTPGCRYGVAAGPFTRLAIPPPARTALIWAGVGSVISSCASCSRASSSAMRTLP